MINFALGEWIMVGAGHVEAGVHGAGLVPLDLSFTGGHIYGILSLRE